MRIVPALLFSTALYSMTCGAASAHTVSDCYQTTLETPSSSERIIAVCTAAIRASSGASRASALVSRGVGYERQKNLDAAMANFDEATRLNPANSWARSNRANIWRLKRNYDRAVSELNDLIRRDPQFIGAYVDRGMVHQERGDIQSARADFQAVLEMKSTQVALDKWAKETARQRLDELAKK